MSKIVNLVAVQMSSSPEPLANFSWLTDELKSADLLPGSIVVLPECFSCFGGAENAQSNYVESQEGGALTQRLFTLAEKYQCHLFAGTMPIASPDLHLGEARFSAGCRYIDGASSKPAQQKAIYNKIHLFDADVNDNTGSYRESTTTQPGEEVVVVKIDSLNVGIAVCYDVRFSGLFNAMGDIDLLVLPSAFTQRTGEAHWEPLVRARAIEKQCFVIAPNQAGVHANERQTFGHSMIVSPWGEILAQKPKMPGIVQTQVDFDSIKQYKQAMPIRNHAKFRSHFVK